MHQAGGCCASQWEALLQLQGWAEDMGRGYGHARYASGGGLLRAKVGREVAAGSCRYVAALTAGGQRLAGLVTALDVGGQGET